MYKPLSDVLSSRFAINTAVFLTWFVTDHDTTVRGIYRVGNGRGSLHRAEKSDWSVSLTVSARHPTFGGRRDRSDTALFEFRLSTRVVSYGICLGACHCEAEKQDLSPIFLKPQILL